MMHKRFGCFWVMAFLLAGLSFPAASAQQSQTAAELWFEFLADSRTLYLQYNAVANKHDGETLAAFFRRVFQFVEANPVEKFVIDLRGNSGGNGVLNWPLIYGLIRSDKVNQKGRLFTLIGRQTFSAGLHAAALLELHTRTLFVGEPTGGKVNSYGDHIQLTLPHSRLEVFIAPYFYQNTYPWDERHWIAPQIQAEFSFEDYRANHDPALAAIKSYEKALQLNPHQNSAVEALKRLREK